MRLSRILNLLSGVAPPPPPVPQGRGSRVGGWWMPYVAYYYSQSYQQYEEQNDKIMADHRFQKAVIRAHLEMVKMEQARYHQGLIKTAIWSVLLSEL